MDLPQCGNLGVHRDSGCSFRSIHPTDNNNQLLVQYTYSFSYSGTASWSPLYDLCMTRHCKPSDGSNEQKSHYANLCLSLTERLVPISSSVRTLVHVYRCNTEEGDQDLMSELSQIYLSAKNLVSPVDEGGCCRHVRLCPCSSINFSEHLDISEVTSTHPQRLG